MKSLTSQPIEYFLERSLALRKHYLRGLGISLIVPVSFLLVALWGEGTVAAAWRVVSGDWLIVSAVTVSVAISISIGSYARELSRSTGAMACSASGSLASMVAMVSCCLHHATDTLAAMSVVLGSSAVFLLQYRVEFVAVGLVINTFGIGLMLRQIYLYKSKMQGE